MIKFKIKTLNLIDENFHNLMSYCNFVINILIDILTKIHFNYQKRHHARRNKIGTPI